MEASTIPVTAELAPARTTGGRIVAGPLLRLRSDEQLVRLFRAGSDEAFGAIHDRYRTRLFAYARQMLGGSRADAEDALQDVFVRAYGALRASDREVSLRPWLYRIAHNRCIDELRRLGGIGAPGAPPALLELVQAPAADPMDAVERRESLRRLVEDVRRLPEQQRSALLMREISGMAYRDLADALEVTVPAVKSLLVRARISLAQAAEARDTACAAIRADLADAHERGVRASGLARRHLHDCTTCSAYRRELRALDARLAALVPALGPAALAAKLLGGLLGGGGGSGLAGGGGTGAGAAGAAAAGGSGASAAAVGGGGAAAASAGAAAGGGTAAAAAGASAAGVAGAGLGASHIAAVVAVAVATAGGAVEVHQTLVPPPPHTAIHRTVAAASLPPRAARGAASDSIDAARLRDAARRLQLRVVPMLTGDAIPLGTGAPGAGTVTGPTVVPTLDPNAAPPAPPTGGAAAPADPSAGAPDPATPPVDPNAGADGGTVVGATSGSSDAPPPPPPGGPPGGDATTAPPAGSEPPPPPATSAAPATGAGTPPPTSATVGGATYPPHR